MDLKYVIITDPEAFNRDKVEIDIFPLRNPGDSKYKYWGTVIIGSLHWQGLFTCSQFADYGFLFV